MTVLLAFTACFTFSLCGFTALSMTLDRHYADIHGRGTAPARRTLRRLHAAGWLALALAWAAQVLNEGWPVGTIYWLGIMALSAAVLVCVLARSPGVSLRVAPWMAATGAASLACLWTMAGRG